jgi:hypothetical protein
MIDVKLKNVHTPLTGIWVLYYLTRREVAIPIARAGGLNVRPALKCGTGAATRAGSVSLDRLKRCANT